MARYLSGLAVVAIALLWNLGQQETDIRAADISGCQENLQIQELKARLLKLEAEVHRLKTNVATLKKSRAKSAVLDEAMVLGQWVGGPQSIVLSFESGNRFEINGNPSTGPVRGRGTWKLDESGQVVATYKYDGNPDWAATELPLTYTNVESLEFAGASYQRRTSVDLPCE